MNKEYQVTVENIARFAKINEEMREYTAYAEGQFYMNFKDLSLMQVHILRIINYHKPCPMKQIATTAKITLGSVTQIVDKLVAKKYVKRVDSKVDRRVVYAELTVKGKKVITATMDHIETVANDILSKFTAKEQAQLLDFMQKMMK